MEGPKGVRDCHGNSRFPVLSDESKGWPAASVGGTVNFKWVLTARHATSTWEYFIGGTRITELEGGGNEQIKELATTIRESRTEEISRLPALVG